MKERKPETESGRGPKAFGFSAHREEMKKRVRLLLVDDHPVVRRGLRFCLEQHPHLEIVGEAADGQEALRKAKELAPDIVVMDLDLPRLDGVAATEALRKRLPHIKVLILFMRQHTPYVLRLLRSGAAGYLSKEASPEELVRAIETVHQGRHHFSEAIARAALTQFLASDGPNGPLARLPDRERQVLALVAEGQVSKQIADNLGLAVRTIETYRARVMRRLAIHSVAGLTRYAIAQGLIPLEAGREQYAAPQVSLE